MMSNISLRLPGSLHKAVEKLAQKDSTSINQFIVSALAEKISALMAEDRSERKNDACKKLSILWC